MSALAQIRRSRSAREPVLHESLGHIRNPEFNRAMGSLNRQLGYVLSLNRENLFVLVLQLKPGGGNSGANNIKFWFILRLNSAIHGTIWQYMAKYGNKKVTVIEKTCDGSSD